MPKKKKKIGSLARKTNEIIKKLAAIQVRADAFRKKLADGVPEISHIDSK
jgi:predicted kinase